MARQVWYRYRHGVVLGLAGRFRASIEVSLRASDSAAAAGDTAAGAWAPTGTLDRAATHATSRTITFMSSL